MSDFSNDERNGAENQSGGSIEQCNNTQSGSDVALILNEEIGYDFRCIRSWNDLQKVCCQRCGSYEKSADKQWDKDGLGRSG